MSEKNKNKDTGEKEHKGKGKAKGEDPDPKKKIEAELENESSSEEEELKITRVGYVHVKQKKSWKPAYCLLIGGTFYYYKNSKDPDTKVKVELADAKVIHPVKGEKKQYSFSLFKGEEALFIGACTGEPELDQWVRVLNESLRKPPADAPAASGVNKKKPGVLDRAKKRAASKTATSVLGKKVMKAIVNDETTTLLNALKRIVKHESGSAKKADELEKNIIKIAVKSFLLIENKILSADDFLVADKPLRDAFELMVKVFNGRGRVKDDKITEALKRVEDMLKKAEEVITNLLAPHLTAKNMLRISAAFGCIANDKFLNQVFREEELENDLDKLIDAMEYYTQFHYH